MLEMLETIDPAAAPVAADRAPGAGPAPAPSPARRRPGRPRDPTLDAAILAEAEKQLRERGYGEMSMESVAAGAATTVPALRRRYNNKVSLATAVIDSMRIEPLRTRTEGPPRERAVAILENFRRNLEREHSMALLGTMLVEEGRNPQLLERFRARLVKARRQLLADALQAGIAAGELPKDTDIDVTVNMLIGSFYAHYTSRGRIPPNWPRRIMHQIWPTRPAPTKPRQASRSTRPT
jgi:AcrR family transcriptional regulator